MGLWKTMMDISTKGPNELTGYQMPIDYKHALKDTY